MPDPVLDEKHGVGVKDPPDLEGDVVNISHLQATTDDHGGVQDLVVNPHKVVESSENIVAQVLAAEIAKDLHDIDTAHSLVSVHTVGYPAPTRVPTGVVPGSVELMEG